MSRSILILLACGRGSERVYGSNIKGNRGPILPFCEQRDAYFRNNRCALECDQRPVYTFRLSLRFRSRGDLPTHSRHFKYHSRISFHGPALSVISPMLRLMRVASGLEGGRGRRSAWYKNSGKITDWSISINKVNVFGNGS